MKFDFQRVKTPAYLTSVALVVIGLLCAVGSLAVLAWILTILGIALNVVAVSITAIDDLPARARRTGTRVVEDSEPETDQHDVVAPARAQHSVSGRSAASAGTSAQGGSSAVRPSAAPARDRAEF